MGCFLGCFSDNAGVKRRCQLVRTQFEACRGAHYRALLEGKNKAHFADEVNIP